MNDNSFDFIVVGAGLAGLYAALQAAHHGTVALITKTSLEVSNSYLAQGGIAAVLGEDDSPEFHIDDTIRTGRELCNPEAVDILINQGREVVKSLIDKGMTFDVVDGMISFGLEGGHSKRRVLHAGNGSTGKEMVEFLIPFVLNEYNIQVFENTSVFQLIITDQSCCGVHCVNTETQNAFSLSGGCTMIATGGASALYSRTTNNSWSVGEGISLAYDAGADIESMEFQQFHPTALHSENKDPFLISEAVRGEGAWLVDHHGERFLRKVGLEELSPRDVVSMAIFNHLKESDHQYVFLKMNHLGTDKIKNRFKTIYEKLLEYQVDITREWIPVAPAAHYTIGGVKTGLHGETTVKQLYAAGEVASTGVHGANRMASNSLLECLVFAKRAVEHAVSTGSINKQTPPKHTESDRESVESKVTTSTNNKNSMKDPSTVLIHNQYRLRYDEIKEAVGKIMWNDVGIIRDELSLNHALKQFENMEAQLRFDGTDYFQSKARSLIQVAKIIAESALARKESRGCHYRSDIPDKSNDYLGTIIVRNNHPPRFMKI